MEIINETINGIAFNLLPIVGGTFFMGNEEVLALHNVHKVELSDFYMAEIPVTVSLFYQFAREVIENTESKETGSYLWLNNGFRLTEGINWQHDEKGQLRNHFDSNQPIVNVNWCEAEAFCLWLRQKTGKPYRLPTEAEWEFAARGGNLSRNFRYAGSNRLTEAGIFNQKRRNYGPKPVASLQPNELGLYDMSGNGLTNPLTNDTNQEIPETRKF